MSAIANTSDAARGPEAPSSPERDALAVLQPGFAGTTAPDWLLRQLAEGLGSVGLFARNIESPAQLAALTAQLRAVRPDVLVAADEEGGDVTRLEARGGSSFPGNLALGAVDDLKLTRAVAAELGRRLAACGVNFNWAPSADVNSDPGNPVIGVRSFGVDPRPGRPQHRRLRRRAPVRGRRRLRQALPRARRHRHRLAPGDAPDRRGHRDPPGPRTGALPGRVRGRRQGRDERAHPRARPRPGPARHPQPGDPHTACCAHRASRAASATTVSWSPTASRCRPSRRRTASSAAP